MNSPNEFLGMFQSKLRFVLHIGDVVVHLSEDVFVIEKLRIDLIRRQITMTNNEDFRRFVTRGLMNRSNVRTERRGDFPNLRFGGIDSFEHLLENPQQGVVIFRTKHFRHE